MTLEMILQDGYRRRRLIDAMMRLLCLSMALLGVSLLVGIMAYVTVKGAGALNRDFFVALPAPVGESGGGLANALVGSAILVAMASLIGIPWGICSGIYLAEFGRSFLASIIRFTIDLLASVPSIVVGLLVYVMVVRPMSRFSAVAGAIALSIIMVPTVARGTEELLKMVPQQVREAGLALGISRWRVILSIVVRGILPAIGTAVILAIARVAGETAPLLFTAMNNRFWHQGLDQPIASLPVQIYTYAIAPFESMHQQAWGAALVLVGFVLFVNLVTRLILRQPMGRASKG